MEGDTIVALSTPPGESGIAVVRLSGPGAAEILEGLAPGAGRSPSHRLSLHVLRDASGEPIDEAVVSLRRAPASYTGEDLVEISCHGSMQVVSELLEEIVRLGGRLASPGEFTKRAFLGGKMDLSQAEAVADLISAETKLQRRVALEEVRGALERSVRPLEEALLEELALVEASIDFSDDEVGVHSPVAARESAGRIRGEIDRLLEAEIAGAKLRRGIRVTIVGPRNAGKSSLYNALLGEERAIVSALPGTTRDLLRERIHIEGFTCYLEDTAGMAASPCEIEARGIEIARSAARRADLVLFVLDGSAGAPAESSGEISRLEAGGLLVVLNKKDLGLERGLEEMRALLGGADAIAVSALTGEGLDELRKRIYERGVKREAGELASERVAVNARQAAALRESREALDRLEALVDDGAQAELLAVEVRAALEALGKVTGRSASEDLLEIIFNKFCIGK